MDRLQAMHVFVRVVESGTFTKAADSLDMPKGTVTRLVQTLEKHLRTRLLNRTTRRVTVTPDGAAYYERAVRVLSEIAEMEGAMTQARVVPRGRIRVDVLGVVGRLIVVPALPEFHARYPEIQIDMGVSDRPVDLIGDQIDCVVRGGEITDQSLVARRIGVFRDLFCASPGYLKRHGVPRHPTDLESDDHRVVTYFSPRTGRPYPFDMRRGDEAHEIWGKPIVSLNDGSSILAAGLAGLGVVRVWQFMAKPHLERGELVPVLADWPGDPWSMYVAYPPNRHLSNKLRVFVDWVANLVAQHTGAKDVLPNADPADGWRS
jgi:LysR family transcriptional regulator, regulator for bpeEF and oprC